MIFCSSIFKTQAEELIQKFLKHLAYTKRLAHCTIQSYSSDLLQLQSFWKELESSVESISLQDIVKKFVMKLLYNKELGTKTIARKISCLKSFKKFLNAQEYSLDLPIKCPKVKKKIPTVLTEEEISLILDQQQEPYPLQYRDKAILELLYATGIRCNELINIKLENIVWEEKYILIKQGKGNKDRIVLFGNKAYKALKQYINCERIKTDNNAYLFLSTQNNRLSTRTIQRILENVKNVHPQIKTITPHILRHSFATHMLARGASLRTVQELLGHSNLTTTELYTHVDKTEMANFLEKNHPLQNVLYKKAAK